MRAFAIPVKNRDIFSCEQIGVKSVLQVVLDWVTTSPCVHIILFAKN
jgi:hypothetical protein